ncbi:MAG TPA: magnesium/cobalt transporter CorA [candidate division Zixibacteria bacterium]|nr:magnesium/cobalt transporter CorA [candidate division Zixibacteria bacterium]
MTDLDSSAICFVRRGSGGLHRLSPVEFGQIDVLRREPGTIVWLALTAPTAEHLRLLAGEFGLHPLALEDVRKRGQRPKLDSYADQHMLVVYEAPGGSTELAELHVFIGAGWLVTVQWTDSPAVEAARRHFESASDGPGRAVGGVLYALFDAAADSYFPLLDAMAERMDALEDKVLGGDGGSDGLREMLAIKRELLELRRVLGPMRDVANALLRRDVPVIEDAAIPYVQDLYDHLVRILDQVDLYRDLLASILDARLTVTSNALNAIMKRLTALTVILMVPTLIAGIYGMNFSHMPELSWVLGYPFALGLMGTAAFVAFWFFRRHDWF